MIGTASSGGGLIAGGEASTGVDEAQWLRVSDFADTGKSK